MKAFSIVLALVVVGNTITPVAAEYAVKIFFNQGIEDSSKVCSEADWGVVVNAVNTATVQATRRQRELTTTMTAATCRSLCGSIPKRLCIIAAPKCSSINFRRNLDEEENDEQDVESAIVEAEPAVVEQGHRDLTWVDNTCEQDKSILQTALDSVRWSVAPSCQALIGEQWSRTMICVDVDSCVIHHLDLYNADTNVLVRANFPEWGGEICQSNTKYTFRAVTNYCVSSVRFDMWGWNYHKGQTEIGAPYYMYGRNGDDIFGDTLIRSGYQIHAQADGSWSHVKSVNFSVKNCGVLNRFDLWNADTDAVLVSNFQPYGGNICKSNRITFEAVTNEHALFVKFDMWGPNGLYVTRTETGGKFTLYGDNGSNVEGDYLVEGFYILKAFVNDAYETVKELQFNVQNC